MAIVRLLVNRIYNRLWCVFFLDFLNLLALHFSTVYKRFTESYILHFGNGNDFTNDLTKLFLRDSTLWTFVTHQAL